MPARKRAQEAARAARRGRPDLRASDVALVGTQVQSEDAWAMRTCSVCGSAYCADVEHWED